jgi:hypothetical protein
MDVIVPWFGIDFVETSQPMAASATYSADATNGKVL